MNALLASSRVFNLMRDEVGTGREGGGGATVSLGAD